MACEGFGLVRVFAYMVCLYVLFIQLVGVLGLWAVLLFFLVFVEYLRMRSWFTIGKIGCFEDGLLQFFS